MQRRPEAVGVASPGGQGLSDIGKTIGQRIRELRTQRSERWTQEDLAERARISVSFLSMIERGERVAHVETLASLADALGVTLAELFVAPAEKPADQQEILRPLSEFVRSRHLDSRDVEKLLGVARAMFAASNGVA
jgi:transcriptional regulator with XRE-family HTH domain